jgi:hypothetical protein
LLKREAVHAGAVFELVDELEFGAVDQAEDLIDVRRVNHFVGEGVAELFKGEPASPTGDLEQLVKSGMEVAGHWSAP